MYYLVGGSEILHQLRLVVYPIGSLSHHLQGFKNIQGGCLGFLNHQMHWVDSLILVVSTKTSWKATWRADQRFCSSVPTRIPQAVFRLEKDGGLTNHFGWKKRVGNIDLGGGFKYFLFSSLPVEMIQFDDHIFQMGWNHQPVMEGSQSQVNSWKKFCSGRLHGSWSGACKGVSAASWKPRLDRISMTWCLKQLCPPGRYTYIYT